MIDPAEGPVPNLRLDRAAFNGWEATRKGRYERVDGVPVRMAAERWRHNQIKKQLCRALDEAIEGARLPCMAAADGMRVEIGDDVDYEPDALVICGERPDLDDVAVRAPVLVAEVTSRSTYRLDTTGKLTDYFRLPSLVHYLIVAADRRLVVHHRRDGTEIVPRIVTAGTIACDPPGLVVGLGRIYGDLIP